MLWDDDCTEVLAGAKVQNKKKAETQVLLYPGGETPNFAQAYLSQSTQTANRDELVAPAFS